MVVCKFCHQEFAAVLWDGKLKLPFHKPQGEQIYACSGSDELLSNAVIGYEHGHQEASVLPTFRGNVAKPPRRRSKIRIEPDRDWYNKD